MCLYVSKKLIVLMFCQSQQKILNTMACLFLGSLTCQQVISYLRLVHHITKFTSRYSFGPTRLLKLLIESFNYCFTVRKVVQNTFHHAAHCTSIRLCIVDSF